ncbi:MAG TPA: serine hydrolase domain-containing protein [Acidimicrobiales bacterium]|nr:serine hydrolase domain-containing protein [Acidimicrobiales bacterium]
MSGIDRLGTTLPGRLADLAREHGVVGASLAVRQGDAVVRAATGVTNLRTGVEVTPDTLFQIGSISKSYTAALVMQLVDEGLVDLDAPVQTYVPDFTTAQPEAAARVTVRHLLNHTSGVDGDVFADFGRGDDCVERYVAAMSGLDHIHPVGSLFSYCNSGYVLLGRLVELVRGCGWDRALQEHLLRPLGVADSVTLPEEVLLRGSAVGHLPTGADGALEVAKAWHLSRALGPAGVISAPAHEVLALARMLTDDGRAADGTAVLSPASVKAMRQLEVELPDPYTLGAGWGLGVILFSLGPPLVFGHDGTTLGQNAYLRVVPDADLAVVLLANGGGAGGLFDALLRPLLSELAGATLNPVPEPPAVPPDVDPGPFLGVFERAGARLRVTGDDGRLWVQTTVTGPLAGTLPQEPPREVVALDDTTLVTAEADRRSGRHLTLKFLEPSGSGFGYVHFGARTTPRVAG